jgi:hypothetical protein
MTRCRRSHPRAAPSSVWGYPTAGHLAMGPAGLVLLAQHSITAHADAITFVRARANRGPL